jgi:hypothetical protein
MTLGRQQACCWWFVAVDMTQPPLLPGCGENRRCEMAKPETELDVKSKDIDKGRPGSRHRSQPTPSQGMAIAPGRPDHRQPGGHMRPADRPGLRRRGLVLAAVLVLATLAAGCSSSNSSSSKPAYCAAASQLKTSVHDLGNVNINVHDLSSVNTAVSKVQADAKTFASEAKSAYPSQTTALQNSVSSLETAVTSAMAQPSLTTVAAVVSSVTQVKTAAGNAQTAVKGKCQ